MLTKAISIAGVASTLPSNTLTDPYLTIALWTGIGAFALTFVLAVQIVVLRVFRRRAERHERKAVKIWQPILNAVTAEVPPATLPRLNEREHIIFLRLWVHLRASFRGTAAVALNDLGYRVGGDAIAEKLLNQGTRSERLLAMLVLGYLGDRKAWSALMLQVNAVELDSTSSWYAAWALVNIDAASAVPHLIALIIERDDWPLSQVVTLLQDVHDICAPLLIDAIPALGSAHLPRALRIAEALRVTLPVPLHEKLLCDPSTEVIIAGLRFVDNLEFMEQIRMLAIHADWRVRVHVARALGRIGVGADINLLKGLLTDAQWWVRYRAAQALVSLPAFVGHEVSDLANDAEDNFASDMLKLVLAEDAPA